MNFLPPLVRTASLILASAGLALAPIGALAKSATTSAVHPVVVAAEPEAARAGMAILKRGGTAIDAAVAIQAALSLLEPQSSGIGGGAFLLYFDARTRKVTAYDGRETAPASASPAMLLAEDGAVLPFATAVVSGRATGVPGAMFMLEQAHKDHGRLAWRSLFSESITLAERGFHIPPRLGRSLHSGLSPQMRTPDVQRYFGNGKGGFVRTGDWHRNLEYGQTLRTIARQGMAAFRKGPLAEAIVEKVSDGPLPGGMQLADLQNYRPKAGEPVCQPYRVKVVVCVPSLPSGGVSVLQGLKLLEQFPIDEWGISRQFGNHWCLRH